MRFLIYHIFNFLARRLPFTMAISVFSSTAGIISGLVAYLFVKDISRFSLTNTQTVFSIVFFTAIILAFIIHQVLFGMFRLLDIKLEIKKLIIINDYIENGKIREDAEPDAVELLLNRLSYLPWWNTITCAVLSCLTIVVCIVAEFSTSRSIVNILPIIEAGVMAVLVYVAFTYTFTEAITSGYRRECKRRLVIMGRNFPPLYFTSFGVKLGFLAILMFISLLVVFILFYNDFPTRGMTSFISFAVLYLGIVMAFISLIIISIRQPLKEIRSATVDMAKGGKGRVISGSLDMEFTQLASNMEEATMEIHRNQEQRKASEQKYRELSEQLDLKVKERTRELEAAYRTLQETQEMLVRKEKMATIGQLAISVNHEINNPLASILGNVQLLSGKLKNLDESDRGKLKVIEKQAIRIAEVVKKVDNVTKPVLVEYVNGIKMIDLDLSTQPLDNVITLDSNYIRTLENLIFEMEDLNPELHGHSQNVERMSMMIADKMNINPDMKTVLQKSARLHDIGMLVIDDRIINKEEPLTDGELSAIREHTIIGAKFLESVDDMVLERKIIKHHHEDYDGNGYPDQLKGNDIPLLARIIRVADTCDALTNNRIYRNAYSPEEAMSMIRKDVGLKYDPAIVDVFESILPEITSGSGT